LVVAGLPRQTKDAMDQVEMQPISTRDTIKTVTRYGDSERADLLLEHIPSIHPGT